jgi:hypothetical protein
MHSRLIVGKPSMPAASLWTALRSCLVLLLWAALTTGSLEAQGSYCRTAADTAGPFLASLQGSYDIVDTVWMKSQGFPYATPEAVTLVTQPSTCKSAVAAYNKATGITPPLASVYVAALGKKGYVIMNPQDHAGDYQSMWVFDTHWTMKQGIFH